MTIDTVIENYDDDSIWIEVDIKDTIQLKKDMLHYLLSREDKENERSTVRMTDISSNLLRIVDYETDMNSKTKTLSALLHIGVNAMVASFDQELWDMFNEDYHKHDVDNLIRGSFLLNDTNKYMRHMQRSGMLSIVKQMMQDTLSVIFRSPNYKTYPHHYYHDEYVSHIFDIFRTRFCMSQSEIVDIVMMFALNNSDIILMLGEEQINIVNDTTKKVSNLLTSAMTNYLTVT